MKRVGILSFLLFFSVNTFFPVNTLFNLIFFLQINIMNST